MDRKQIILDHMDMAKRIACSFRSREFTQEDFVSMAYIGLCEAANKYDPTKGCFSTFAYRRVYGAIIDHLRIIHGRSGDRTYWLKFNQYVIDNTLSDRDEIGQFEDREYLEKLLPFLSSRELRVIKMLYIKELQLIDSGLVEGVVSSRISQLKTEALKKMKDKAISLK